MATLRFLHTADWQLGLRAAYIPGDAGAEVRNARLRTVRRILQVARDQGVAFILVAGDVFENHALRPGTVRKALDTLRDLDRPVYLLPGNHDPHTPDSLYRSALWQRECPSNVHVLASKDPVPLREDACLLPCPLLERVTLEDPAAHLQPDFGPAGVIRIGLAHGGIREVLAGMTDDQYELRTAISLHTAERAALDYLALGDWHGCFQVNQRTWYSGTPEATRFKERDPGKVLLVEIAQPGASPEVTPITVQSLRWLRMEHELDDQHDLAALAKQLDAIPEKTDCLLELRLRGTMDAALYARLRSEILDSAADRFRWMRLRDESLQVLVRQEQLDEIAREGWMREVVDTLAEQPGPDADRALRLLYRLHHQVSP